MALHDEFTAHDLQRKNRLTRNIVDGDIKPQKKLRATPSAEGLADLSKSDLKKFVVNGRLEKQTVPHLKDICSLKGLSTWGKKAELVARIQQWVEGSL